MSKMVVRTKALERTVASVMTERTTTREILSACRTWGSQAPVAFRDLLKASWGRLSMDWFGRDMLSVPLFPQTCIYTAASFTVDPPKEQGHPLAVQL